MAKRSKTSRQWLKEHFDDPFVQRAQHQGYRSRASYKLLEIDERDRLLRRGMSVIDLGAAPGGWSQVVANRLGGSGRVVALDLLEMAPIPEVVAIQGDFREPEPYQQLLQHITLGEVDLVLSDMAPNSSGQKAVDQPRALYLAELTLQLATEVLRPGGDMVVKIFHGEGSDDYLRQCRQQFKRVYTRKPEASRSRSRENYLLARGFCG
ncbi:23S rRNA (uridine(2552)-2'-O)-methyltransferase RlmE [Ectothiorhodospiraceae bacterium BW-2]|nr:23S rRNA (uridine(2552)-2'-O)-methyltransferase RlmE [Ectothiorhodospiraceae bacterium BW-2]